MDGDRVTDMPILSVRTAAGNLYPVWNVTTWRDPGNVDSLGHCSWKSTGMEPLHARVEYGIKDGWTNQVSGLIVSGVGADWRSLPLGDDRLFHDQDTNCIYVLSKVNSEILRAGAFTSREVIQEWLDNLDYGFRQMRPAWVGGEYDSTCMGCGEQVRVPFEAHEDQCFRALLLRDLDNLEVTLTPTAYLRVPVGERS